MKRHESISRSFLRIALGLAMLCTAASLLIFSIGRTFAQQSAEPVQGLFDASPGTYQLQYSQIDGGERIFYRAVILNTKTAQSRYFYYDYFEEKWMESAKQIPTGPF